MAHQQDPDLPVSAGGAAHTSTERVPAITAATFRLDNIRECPRGHNLRRGHRQDDPIVGWVPCDCAPALAEIKGHRTVQCWTCHLEGFTVIGHWPPCHHQSDTEWHAKERTAADSW